MRAEDVLPDSIDSASFGGVTVRKGTIAAFIANARIVADRTATPESRATAERDIVESVPALRATGLFEVTRALDPRVRALVDGGATASDVAK